MYGIEAFVLSSTDVGEYDRLYSLLTQEFGKVRAIVRSVRKPRAKLAGHLDIPNRAWIELVPTSKGWQVTQALEIKSYPRLRASRDTLQHALAEGRLFDAFLAETQDADLFALWNDFLQHMEDQGGDDRAPARYLAAQCTIRALAHLGFLPDTAACSVCERAFGADPVFLFTHQIICSACSARQRIQGQRISRESLDAVRQILRGAWISHDPCVADVSYFARHFERQSRQYMV